MPDPRFASGELIRRSGALILSMAASYASLALAEEVAPISTERPSFSATPWSLEKGVWQIETGILYVRDDDEQAYEDYSLPNALLRVGVGNRFELRLESVNYLWQEKEGVEHNGWSDLRLGFKWQATGKGDAFALGLHGGLGLPVGDEAFSGDEYRPSAAAFWSYSGGLDWFGTANISYADELFALENAVGISFSLPGNTSSFVEYLGVFTEHSGPKHDLNLGASWLLSNDFQLDVHGTAGLNSRANDLALGVGLSYRFR